MPEFRHLPIDRGKGLLDGTGIYIGLKRSALKAHLNFFQELSLDFVSTMSA
jgi:hypothetical protein